jgi:SNF2 family DNA or RNA helicase
MAYLTVKLERDVGSFIRIRHDKYSELLRRVVADIPGREWVNSKSYWRVPIGSLEVLINSFRTSGIDFEYDDETKDFILEELKMKERLLEIKKSVVDKEVEVEGMTYSLYPYQGVGLDFITTGKRVLLADDMGLGKSVMAIASIIKMKPKRTLVICMNSLKHNWLNEFKKHAPHLKVAVVEGSKARRGGIYNDKKIPILIMNYDLLALDQDIMPDVWDYIIADEVSVIKNHSAKRTRAIKKLKANKVLGMSGTPMENQLMDLHSVMEFIRPGLFGSMWDFRVRHIETGFNGTIAGYKDILGVHKLLAPFAIRRKKENVLKDLPPKTKISIPVELSKEEKELYKKWNKSIVEEINAMGDRTNVWTQNVLTRMLRLKQIVDHPRILEPDYKGPVSKLQTIDDIINSTDEKVVVFTQFADMAHILAMKYGAEVIEGAVDAKERMEIIKRFTDDDSQVLVSTEAGAYGLTITAASIIIHYDLPWNPARMHQREDRLHRISQKKPVTVYEIVAEQTIDEYIVQTLFKKLEAFDLVVEQMDNDEAFVRQSISQQDVNAMLRIVPK